MALGQDEARDLNTVNNGISCTGRVMPNDVRREQMQIWPFGSAPMNGAKNVQCVEWVANTGWGVKYRTCAAVQEYNIAIPM